MLNKFAARSVHLFRYSLGLTNVVIAIPIALLLTYLLSRVFPHPPPFMMGVGRIYMSHRPDNSFPSDHACGMWTMALGLLLWLRNKWIGVLAIALAALTSWARVFVGVHFPFDMAGSVMAALVGIGVVVVLRPLIERLVGKPVAVGYARFAGRVARLRG